MCGLFYLFVYLIGIPLYMWIEKRFFPFEEGDYRIDFLGVHEITRDMWAGEVKARSILWPVVVLVVIALTPILLIDLLFEKI